MPVLINKYQAISVVIKSGFKQKKIINTLVRYWLVKLHTPAHYAKDLKCSADSVSYRAAPIRGLVSLTRVTGKNKPYFWSTIQSTGHRQEKKTGWQETMWSFWRDNAVERSLQAHCNTPATSYHLHFQAKAQGQCWALIRSAIQGLLQCIL